MRFLETNKDSNQNWKEVTSAGTFDSEGKAVKGGLFDPSIFLTTEKEYYELTKDYDMSRNWVPHDIVGTAGKITLVAPILGDKELDSLGFKISADITAVPVLPPELRPNYVAKNGHIIYSKLTKLYINIISLNNKLKELLKEADGNKGLELITYSMALTKAVKDLAIECDRLKDVMDAYLTNSKLARWMYINGKAVKEPTMTYEELKALDDKVNNEIKECYQGGCEDHAYNIAADFSAFISSELRECGIIDEEHLEEAKQLKMMATDRYKKCIEA